MKLKKFFHCDGNQSCHHCCHRAALCLVLPSMFLLEEVFSNLLIQLQKVMSYRGDQEQSCQGLKLRNTGEACIGVESFALEV